MCISRDDMELKELLVGGDLNEDLGKMEDGRRSVYLREFLKEFRVKYKCVSPTFHHSNGLHNSEIDYFLKCGDDQFIDSNKLVLDLAEDVSDHKPIVTNLVVNLSLSKSKNSRIRPTLPSRANWDKIDKDAYRQAVEDDMINTTSPTDLNARMTSLCTVMTNASAKLTGAKKGGKKSKPKLAVWNTDISESLKAARMAHTKWVQSGKIYSPSNTLFQEKKKCKKQFRKLCRRAVAENLTAEREAIMNALVGDRKLFYKLLNKQRGGMKAMVDDIYVGGTCYSGEDALDGFKIHFESLSKVSNSTEFDQLYHTQVNDEFDTIAENIKGIQVDPVTTSEFESALKTIHRGKAADVYGINIEHVVYGGDLLKAELLNAVNSVFEDGAIPSCLKVGLLSPVYKNKGSPAEVTNYRGITVLPVLCKIIEAIIRNRVQAKVLHVQNRTQRGFTKNASPLNAAYILEEFYRDCTDNKTDAHIVLLDAKSAFDVVSHTHLLRRLYHIGINDTHWSLIRSLHENTFSMIKLQNEMSDMFPIAQGVRQGGILSTDLYKSYVNPLLDQFEMTCAGGKIGTLTTNNCACADDVCIMGNSQYDTQLLINMASTFANEERYVLQPTKTVSLFLKNSKKPAGDINFMLEDAPLTSTKSAQHLGITRTTSVKGNVDANVDKNIVKARKSLYSLFGAGLHGENGLDPASAITIYNLYVLPVLLYGLELLVLPQKHIDKLELFQKKTLKQLLSLPDRAADSAVYILSGCFPIQAKLDIKVLTFFNNLCNQDDNSLEKQILVRQLTMRSDKSISWAAHIPPLLARYGLENVFTYIDYPLGKHVWKRSIRAIVEAQWKNHIEAQAQLYPTLVRLNCVFTPGKLHSILNVPCLSSLEVSRVAIRLKLVTGTYILQSNRNRYNQTAVDPQCQLCHSANETVEHFLLRCPALGSVRSPIMDDILSSLHELVKYDVYSDQLGNLTDLNGQRNQLSDLVLDFSKVIPPSLIDNEISARLEFDSRRLIYALHRRRETISANLL